MTDFLRKVDKLTVAMNKEQLVCFIHNEARILNESKRDEFLARLTKFADSSDKKSILNKLEKEDNGMHENLSSIYEHLDHIKSGEAVLISEYNEQYDDWYNDEADIYIYHDPEHITDTILLACQMLHTLIDWEQYVEALKLSNVLLELSINVENEYEDDEPFSFADLFERELISADYEKIILDMLYTAYMTLPLPECAETLYDFMELSECRDINLEKMMQHSARELPHIPEFLDVWTEYLCEKSGNRAEFLLREAVMMVTDHKKLISYAEKYSDTHPCIYDALLEKDSFADAKESVYIGKQALKMVSTHYAVRSNIALKTAEYALAADDLDSAEYCWLEAFRSKPTIVNLFRLMVLCRNFADMEQEIRVIISSDSRQIRLSEHIVGASKELNSYCLKNEDKYGLLFLLGDYMDVLDKGMKRMNTLGWSGTFLKCGIPLFFLLMYKKTHLDNAMKKMCRTASEYMSFHAEDYRCGTQLEPSGNGNEVLFWQLLRQTRCPEKLSNEEQKKVMARLTDLTELRTNLIVSGMKRNYYDECAAYIAALGEVKESHGEKDAKQALLLSYKAKYPRHSAFIRELKSFGLK